MNQLHELYKGYYTQAKTQGQTFEEKYGPDDPSPFVPQTEADLYSNELHNREAEANSIDSEDLTTAASHKEEGQLQSPGAKLPPVNEFGEVDSTTSNNSYKALRALRIL